MNAFWWAYAIYVGLGVIVVIALIWWGMKDGP